MAGRTRLRNEVELAQAHNEVLYRMLQAHLGHAVEITSYMGGATLALECPACTGPHRRGVVLLEAERPAGEAPDREEPAR